MEYKNLEARIYQNREKIVQLQKLLSPYRNEENGYRTKTMVDDLRSENGIKAIQYNGPHDARNYMDSSRYGSNMIVPLFDGNGRSLYYGYRGPGDLPPTDEESYLAA